MSSMYHPPVASQWECDMPRCGATLTPDDDESECEICSKTLCDGCTYECVTCGGQFCIEHRIATHEGEFDAVYECAACLGKRLLPAMEVV